MIKVALGRQNVNMKTKDVKSSTSCRIMLMIKIRVKTRVFLYDLKLKKIRVVW
jgi:hypothetical protein